MAHASVVIGWKSAPLVIRALSGVFGKLSTVFRFTTLVRLGRLPFDDQNHKKLLRQVTKPVNFPEKPPLSKESKNLVRKMLNPIIAKRAPYVELKQDPWFTAHVGKPPVDISNAPVNDRNATRPSLEEDQ